MPFLIAITGGSGAGKTTIARALAERLGQARLIAEDDYYLCASAIAGFDADTHNFDAPAAKDHALLIENLRRARAGEAFQKPVYDLHTHKRTPHSEEIAPADFIIVEGLHIFSSPELREAFDLKVYVHADESLRLGRRIIRDMETRSRTARSVFSQFFANVRPMHDLHVEPQRTFADLVLTCVPNAGEAETAANVARIVSLLPARV